MRLCFVYERLSIMVNYSCAFFKLCFQYVSSKVLPLTLNSGEMHETVITYLSAEYAANFNSMVVNHFGFLSMEYNLGNLLDS